MQLRRGALAPLLLMLVAFPLPGAAEETILVFERQTRKLTHRPPERGGTVPGDTTRAVVTVVLGDRRLSVYEPQGVWLYDFEKNRVLWLNDTDRTYSDWSLFGFVAFGEMELDHRLAVRSRMMAERPGVRPSVLDLETLFSMKAPSTRPGARESFADSSRGDEVRVFINRALAVASQPSDALLTPARQAMFTRFLLYRCNLHPQARRALVRTGKVPRRLFYRYVDFDDENQVLLTLKHVTSTPNANNPMAGSARRDLSDPDHADLARALAACRRCQAEARAPWLETSRQFETQSLAGGRYLDAALAQMERSLACEPRSAWPAEIERLASGDHPLAAYRASHGWKDSTGARLAVQGLEAIDRTGLEKAYVLDFAFGRARLGAGDREEGTNLLLRGVSGNPCLAAAWQELGRGYLESYQPILAWICFDAGRAVRPQDCAAPSESERLEREVLARHPEFFEPAASGQP